MPGQAGLNCPGMSRHFLYAFRRTVYGVYFGIPGTREDTPGHVLIDAYRSED